VLGSALLLVALIGCRQSSSTDASLSPGSTDGGAAFVEGTVSAGPTCPVERNPPDPSCADRPVAGAVLLVLDPAGAEVARTVSAADGTFVVRLRPGVYRLVPQPREGLMGTAQPVDFQVQDGISLPPLRVTYDTGIR